MTVHEIITYEWQFDSCAENKYLKKNIDKSYYIESEQDFFFHSPSYKRKNNVKRRGKEKAWIEVERS